MKITFEPGFAPRKQGKIFALLLRGGFSIVELMMVGMIISIILGIGGPSFNARARDRTFIGCHDFQSKISEILIEKNKFSSKESSLPLIEITADSLRNFLGKDWGVMFPFPCPKGGTYLYSPQSSPTLLLCDIHGTRDNPYLWEPGRGVHFEWFYAIVWANFFWGSISCVALLFIRIVFRLYRLFTMGKKPTDQKFEPLPKRVSLVLYAVLPLLWFYLLWEYQSGCKKKGCFSNRTTMKNAYKIFNQLDPIIAEKTFSENEMRQNLFENRIIRNLPQHPTSACLYEAKCFKETSRAGQYLFHISCVFHKE